MDELPNFEQLGKIVNMLKGAQALSGLMQSDDQTVKKSQSVQLSDFDRELQSPAIRSIKAAIPYLSYDYQRSIGIAVKLMELDLLLNKYTVLAASSDGDNGKKMLLAVKAELPENVKPTADLLIKITEITELLNSYKNLNQYKDFNKGELI
jgi:hypothetical protein